MKKKPIIVVVIAAVLIILAVAGGIYMIPGLLANKKYENAQLLSCRSSYGGDMNGSYRSIELRKISDTEAELIVEEQEAVWTRKETRKYPVNIAELDHVKQMVLEKHLPAAEKRPMSEFFAYDAGSSSFSCWFENGESFSISSNQELKKKETEGVREVVAYLRSLASGEAVVEVEPHEIRISTNEGYTLMFQMNECQATDDLIAWIETLDDAQVEISDYSSNEKIFYPDVELDVSDCPLAESGEAGTLAYYAPWGDVVIFYDSFSPAAGLYELGKIDDLYETTREAIADMEPGEYWIGIGK